MKTATPAASVAASEISLYRSVLEIKKEHDLEELGISFWDAQTTIQWSYNADHYFHAASTMKLAVLLGVFRQIDRGELALDAPVHVRNRFTSIVNQEPFMLDLGRDADPDVYGHLGKTLTIRELAYWMITKSSNLATDLVLEQVGVEAANAVLAQYGSGLSAIRRGIDDVDAQAAGISNEMSPADLAAVLVAVGNDKGPSGDYLRDLLAGNQWNGEIPAGVPAGTRVEHKNGWDTRIRHDGGIVRPEDAEAFVLVVCTTSSLTEAEAQQLIAAIATEAWNHRHALEAVR